jgi:hypothetical protein
LGAPAAGPPRLPRRKRPWLTRLISGRSYDDEVIVYRHSHLFYWWPVWLLGFVFSLVTWIGDRHMAIVPAGTEAAPNREVEVQKDGQPVLERRDVLILAAGKKLPTREDANGKEEIAQPTIRIAPHRSIGTIFLFVLLLVVVLTNISLRGLWSVVVLLTLVLLIVILYLYNNVLGTIVHGLGHLSVYINMGGYIGIAGILFVLWALNFFILDRMTYMVFTPGQVRVRLQIGGGETVYDATGMTVQKQRADMLRHWGLGLGSGDLILFPLNTPHPIEMPNVLRVGRVLREIEDMVKEKVVISSEELTA